MTCIIRITSADFSSLPESAEVVRVDMYINVCIYDVRSWFAEVTMDVDSRNPQVASRLGSCFNIWKKFAPEYQTGMQAALEKIQKSTEN